MISFFRHMSLSAFAILLALGSSGADTSKGEKDCAIRFKRVLSPEWISRMRQEVDDDPGENHVLRNAVQHVGFKKIALNEEIIRNHVPTYSKELPEISITDQAASGRCWIFASCNVQRTRLVKAGRVPEDFEFSQAYVHFYSMLEQSDKWLAETIHVLKPRMSEGKLMKELQVSGAVGDGGGFDSFNFLVEKYGLVPKQAMRESASSANTDTLLKEVRTHLASVTDEMKDAFRGFAFSKTQKKLNRAQIAKLNEIRERGMKGIYRILAAHLGNPPKEFRFRTKQGAVKTFTPQTFARDFVKADTDDFIVVTADPFARTNRVYGYSNSSIGVPGAKGPSGDQRFLNVSVARMQKLVEKSIDEGYAVYFSSDIDADVDYATGIMHPDIFVREPVYGFKADEKPQKVTSRREKLYYDLNGPNHGMMIAGYDRPKGVKTTIKYKVDNSWTTDSGDHGIYHMYLPWFQKYVYRIVVPKSALSPKERKIWNGKAVVDKDLPF